jgi:hypothetical protein
VRSIITDAERIPLYPNALQVEIEPYDDRSPWRQVISYQAPASISELISFYRRELPKTGWVIVTEGNEGQTARLSSTWASDSEATLATLVLSIEQSVSRYLE